MAALAATSVRTESPQNPLLAGCNLSNESRLQIQRKVICERMISWEELQQLGSNFSSTDVCQVDLTGFTGNREAWTTVLEHVLTHFRSIQGITVCGEHFHNDHLQTICHRLGGLLTHLNLHSCSSITTLSYLSPCTGLRGLLIQGCSGLSRASFTEISGLLSRLTSLFLGQDNVEEIVNSFRSTHLGSLNLSGCSINERIIAKVVENYPNLGALCLHSATPGRSNRIEASMLERIGTLQRLSSLFMDWAAHYDDSSLRQLVERRLFPRLEILYIMACPENRFVRQIFAAFPRVIHLHLSDYSRLTDAALAALTPETCQFSRLDFLNCRGIARAAIERFIARAPVNLYWVRFPDGTEWRRTASPLSISLPQHPASSSFSHRPALPTQPPTAAATPSLSSLPPPHPRRPTNPQAVKAPTGTLL